MTTELREEIESEGQRIRGGIYVSCVARGQALFGDAGHEMALIEANLGDVSAGRLLRQRRDRAGHALRLHRRADPVHLSAASAAEPEA